jgi:hypothetical protein
MKSNRFNQPFIKAFKTLASLKLTVICLLIFTILVVWGTVFQADHGLYQAQQKFFHSWFFLLFGFIPLPGTIMVMFVLSVNLVFSIIYRIGFKFRNIGNLITHLGIIILLIGGFFTFYFSEESSLMLQEGQTSSLSTSRSLWELAIWEEKGDLRDIFALDANGFTKGDKIRFDELGVSITIRDYYQNCSAYTSGLAASTTVLNQSGIKLLKEKPLNIENSENTPGIKLSANCSGDSSLILLYGRETLPTKILFSDHKYYFSLRRKRLPLPLSIKLLNFRVKKYPNSNIVKSYESTVFIETDGGVGRDVIISMNKPLRFDDYTFFQSSYYIDKKNGREYSIFAVVKNSGRLLPYFSSGIIFLGMLIHFMMMMIKHSKKSRGSAK